MLERYKQNFIKILQADKMSTNDDATDAMPATPSLQLLIRPYLLRGAVPKVRFTLF